MSEFAKLREELAGLDAKTTPGQWLVSKAKKEARPEKTLFLETLGCDQIADLYVDCGSHLQAFPNDKANADLITKLRNNTALIIRALAIAEVGEEVERVLSEIAEPVFLNLNPKFADPDNVRQLCEGMTKRQDLAIAALSKLKQAREG